MAATDPNALLAQASCYQCYAASGYTALLLKLGLLKQLVLATNPMADTSPNTLLSQAQCYDCNGGSVYTLLLFELALLQIIAGGGGGGGGGAGGNVYCGNYGGNPPPFIPLNGCGAARDTITGRVWWYDGVQWN